LLAVAAALGLGLSVGGWAAAVPLVAGLVLAPLLDAALKRRERNAVAAERRAEALKAFVPAEPTEDVSAAVALDAVAEHGAAWYLRPEAEAVSFRPRLELDELRSWCLADRRIGIRLVAGDGGAGKTRMAIQLARELAASGWRAMWVKPEQEHLAVDRVRASGEATILLVDYAETRPPLDLSGLLASAVEAADVPDMRIILLSRSAGQWWQKLVNGVDYRVTGVLQAAPPVVLGPVTGADGQHAVFNEAVTAFAERLGVLRPVARLALDDPEAVVLVVHAAALLSVLDPSNAARSPLSWSPSDVISELLRHEARYWHKTAAARGLVLDPSVERLAVAAMCLIGAESESAAAALLTHVPDLADSAELRGKVARWLRDLYPATSADAEDWLGSLRPDRVAERLVTGELCDHPGLIRNLLSGFRDRQLGPLTVLARAALHDDRAIGLLRSALDSDFDEMIIDALVVAVQTNPITAGLVSETFAVRTVSPQTLEAIGSALPERTFTFAGLAVAVWQRLAEEADIDGTQLAERLRALSTHLSVLGRWTEALAAAEEAASICRRLAETESEMYLFDLAQSLIQQSACLSQLGRADEALAIAENAIEISGRLVREQSADESSFVFAASLSNLSRCVSDLGQAEDALTWIEGVVSIRRALDEKYADDTTEFLPDLATSLLDQSLRLAQLGHHEKAFVSAQEATEIHRRLVDAPLSVTVHGTFHSDQEEERTAAVAKDIRKALDRVVLLEPYELQSDLARSLTNQAQRLLDLHRSQEALAVTEEATGIYRRLAEARPDYFLSQLVESLETLADSYSALRMNREAAATRQDAREIKEKATAGLTKTGAESETAIRAASAEPGARSSNIGDNPGHRKPIDGECGQGGST
jgi:tetratricopeptide (TPR) repeat protein